LRRVFIVPQIFKILQQDSTHIELDFLPKLRTQTFSRAELAKTCQQKIELSLQDTLPDEIPITLPLAKTI